MSLFDTVPAILPAGIEARLDAFMEGALADGLPLVPPSRESVQRMITAGGRPPGAVLGTMAPLMQECVVSDAAICAVAAGCTRSTSRWCWPHSRP